MERKILNTQHYTELGTKNNGKSWGEDRKINIYDGDRADYFKSTINSENVVLL